jgi:hypothetical protein
MVRKTAARSFLLVSALALGIIAALFAGTPGASGKRPHSAPGETSASGAGTTTTITTTTTSTTTPTVSSLWAAGQEEGSLVGWYAPATSESTLVPHGGGEYDSGVADSVASQEEAHSGGWSAKQTIDTSGGSSGTRLFRWNEFRSLLPGQGAYASVWVFIPQRVQIGGYFNLFQFKSKTQDGSYVDVFFQVGMFSRSDGTMYLKPGWGWGAENPSFPGGPYRGDSSQGKWFTPLTQVNVPVGRWFQLRAYIVPSAGYSGRLLLWQDSNLIYDFENVMTGYANTSSINGVDTQWAVNAYANGLTPSTYVQYVDDASITQG